MTNLKKTRSGLFRSMRTTCVTVAVLFAFVGSANARIIINEVNLGSNDYFEIYNYSTTPTDLTGYTAEFWDSGLGGFNPIPVIGFPSLSLAANSVLTFHENANVAAGEIDTPNMFLFHGRDLSIVIRDNNGDIVDLWAHGDNFFGPPDADSTAIPLNSINTNTNDTTYQRFIVDGSEFDPNNWGAAASTRNNFNLAQVVAVPEPSTWAMMALGLFALALIWRMQRPVADKVAEESKIKVAA